MKRFLVAIDGPAGAGKSTVAKEVAHRLGITYIDSGAMYRAIAWLVMQKEIDPKDEKEIGQLVEETVFELSAKGIQCNGVLLTDQLRSREVSQMASQIATSASVRRVLVQQQREFAQQQSVVMDGRDIGTHVFPHADVKIFLTASVDQRAKRRYNELTAQGLLCDLEQLKREIRERDYNDQNRNLAPLRQAEDAVRMDTTHLEVADVVAQILQLCRTKLGGEE